MHELHFPGVWLVSVFVFAQASLDLLECGCALKIDKIELQHVKPNLDINEIPVALLQIINHKSIVSQAWINGFSSHFLTVLHSGDNNEATGLLTRLESYSAIHPYFLKNGANEIHVESAFNYYISPNEMGPWQLVYRISLMTYLPNTPVGTIFEESELLQLKSPLLTTSKESESLAELKGSFDMHVGPTWAWTKAPPIADSQENQESLRAVVETFWNELNQSYGKPVSAVWMQKTKDSIQEFIQATELRGQRYTLFDDLLNVSSNLKLPGDKSPEEFMADENRRTSHNGPRVYDEEPPQPSFTGDQLPPRLYLKKLDSFENLKMSLIADGRLAHLTSNGEPVIQFVSNYSDGQRGRPHEVRFACDLWFRMNTRNEWELDAVYPQGTSQKSLFDSSPQRLFELKTF